MADRAQVAAMDAALWARESGVARAAERWGALAYAAALAFVATLYANPMFWFPALERFRLGAVTMAACAAAVVLRRVQAGERIRTGAPGSVLLLVYAGIGACSIFWTIAPGPTRTSVGDLAKLVIVYVAILNALDQRRRLRRFMLAGALAALAPALGGIDVWRRGDALIEGTRTHWRGVFADPNRLAMSLVAVLPFTLLWIELARTRRAKLLLGGVAAAQVAAVVLTESRSGSVAMAVALALFLLLRRGTSGALKGAALAVALAVGVAAFAPGSFWRRTGTIADYQEDASVAGRRNAWKVMGVIVDERPLQGVGVGAFLFSWDRFAPLAAGGRRLVAHNIFIEIAGEEGVPALVLFLGFCAWLLVRLWRAGRDSFVGREAQAVLAALAGYLVCESVNGYALSWFLYVLFACAVATLRLAEQHAALGREERTW